MRSFFLLLLLISANLQAKFIDHRGAEFKKSELRNKPYLSAFIFTSCPSTCPKVMRTLKKITLKDPYKETSVYIFTVDPENDTPKVLKKFARKYDVDKASWRFITGDEKEQMTFIKEFFFIPVFKSQDKEHEIMHSDIILFTNQKGESRIIARGE